MDGLPLILVPSLDNEVRGINTHHHACEQAQSSPYHTCLVESLRYEKQSYSDVAFKEICQGVVVRGSPVGNVPGSEMTSGEERRVAHCAVPLILQF